MSHKILLVGLVLFTFLLGLVTSTTKAKKDQDACTDLPNFNDKFGTTCEQTMKFGNCKDGMPAKVTEQELRSDANSDDISVLDACCGCGGGQIETTTNSKLMYDTSTETILQSKTTSSHAGSVEACHDNWRPRKCKISKLQEKCQQKMVAKNCQKTCGICTDVDADKCPPYEYTPYKGCGIRQKSARIIEGDDVSPHSIPWQVGIYSVANEFARINCGGTLLTNKHVITAAHCLFYENDDGIDFYVSMVEALDIFVVVAEHNQTDSVDGIQHDVRSFTNHPQWNQSAFGDYDFSMLHLTLPVEFGDRAMPACLPDLRFSEDKLVGKYLTVSGWGKTENPDYDDNYGYPDLLQSVDVTVVSQHECTKAFNYTPPDEITNAMICARHPTGEKDSCNGDSGGPLTYKENGRSYLIGVVSFGEECADPEYPGVYARVTSVLDWIHKELRSSC